MIVVLGSINLDIRFDVETLPLAGETLHARGRSYFGGGKGANQVLAAKRAGAEARLFGAVGDDDFAKIALRELVEAGVTLSGVAVVAEETGSANIYVDCLGENCIVVAAGANGLVNIEMVVSAVSAMQGGILVLQQEIPFATNRAALELARLHGVKTILNVSPFDASSAELSRLADIVIANEHEWARLNDGQVGHDAMREWCRRNDKILVVTKGAEGVAVSTAKELFEIAAPAIRPLDTVGAGDTFCGYFAAELDRGGSLREAAKIAVVAASIACLRAGAQPSIPLRHEVLSAMAKPQSP